MERINKRSQFNIFILSTLGALILILGAPFPSAAQVSGKTYYIEETFFPVYVNENDTTQADLNFDYKVKSGIGYDFRTTIGYVFRDSIVVGLTYNYYMLSTKLPAGTYEGQDETTKKSELGPTVGYLWGQTRFMLTYFVSGERIIDRKDTDLAGVVSGDVTFKNTSKSGFQFMVGYTFNLWRSLEIGPTMVYRSVTYQKQSKNNRLNASDSYSGNLGSAAVESKLTPMISLLFPF